jgi:hypothetical protein
MMNWEQPPPTESPLPRPVLPLDYEAQIASRVVVIRTRYALACVWMAYLVATIAIAILQFFVVGSRLFLSIQAVRNVMLALDLLEVCSGLLLFTAALMGAAQLSSVTASLLYVLHKFGPYWYWMFNLGRLIGFIAVLCVAIAFFLAWRKLRRV